MFRSYEPGREGFVTLIANYQPPQDPYGGPNYSTLDPDAQYRNEIENDGEPESGLIFLFRFFNTLRDIQIPVGGEEVSIRCATPARCRVVLALDRPGLWLIKTVHMEAAAAGAGAVDWQSWWASLTFRLTSTEGDGGNRRR